MCRGMGGQTERKGKQEARLPQRDRANMLVYTAVILSSRD